MKTLIFLLTLAFSVPVLAEEYTEYVYVSTEETKPIVDEFTKYEPLILHNYYSLVKKDEIILDKYDPQRKGYSQCSKEPIEKKKIYSLWPHENYENENWTILRGQENYKVASLKVENMSTDILKIDKIAIKKNDTLVSYFEVGEDATIIIPIDNIETDDLIVEFTYKATDYGRIIYTLNGDTSTPINMIAVLRNDNTKASFRGLSLASFEKYVTERNLPNKKSVDYYIYEEENYLCYNEEKTYFGLSEEKVLNGYVYDPKEDKEVYKVYRRQLIISSPEQEESIRVELPASPKPTTSTEEQPSSYKYSEGLYFNRNENTKVEKEDITKEPPNEYLAFLDEESKTDNSTCKEDTEQPNILRQIKLLLLILIILIILHIIHTFNVNNSTKN